MVIYTVLAKKSKKSTTKIEKIYKKTKKLKIFGTISGALARSLIVYKVLSIYRVLPGFREFAVF